MIEKFLRLTIEKNGSDLHLSSNNVPTVRVDGDLVKIGWEKSIPEFINESAKKILSKEKFQIFISGDEVDYSFRYNKDYRFRINCFHNINGPSISFRCLKNNILSLEKIMAPETFKKLCHLEKGLIIVSGATGSGKSTTLAAMIEYINHNFTKHIISIEDPIEYIHDSEKALIEQIEIGQNTRSFSHALKHSMRQDPDIIVIGEVRDLETMRLALTAAETGHLVFATLHTNSSYQAINRIIDVFPENDKNTVRSMLSLSLKGVICQKLVKKKKGGRCAAFEIMVATSAIQNLIRSNNIHNLHSSIETGSKFGMTTMDQYLKKLTNENIIDPIHSF
ncbi:PilT/PilU family type 4a pilus ATPase [Rickettsiales bacterium]|nr:PilT/PilU family type 4a pilus ATPase [Rickettsiales bacterium]MDB2550650.1 PilT/PilU family type 4a pilus ATPase [Rickettsiales bacterium]